MPESSPIPTISIADYTYSLPEDKIALHPLPERDASRLLVFRTGQISEDVYRNIATHLPENSIIVFNNTRVVNARIRFQKPSGGVIEVFCLEPSGREMALAMQVQQEMDICCFIGGASKWKPGMVLSKNIAINGETITLNATIRERTPAHFVVSLQWNTTASFAEILQAAGDVPLPPYIKRNTGETDTERYQTVYARHEGSVAAPTAGLHFSPLVLNSLEQKNIQSLLVTLHVGAGTFQPVKTSSINEHQMHGEWIHIPKTTIEALAQNPEMPVTAVGTTSLRTLESLYWCGVQLAADQNNKQGFLLNQWDAYTLPQHFSRTEALQQVLNFLNREGLTELAAYTRLLIVPGYRLRMVSALVTNFHQPQSTLLLLVAAVAGEHWSSIYDYALENDFRFLSYGDGCLIIP